ncbi:MAG: response regulator [Caldithrix sp.]|nr:response regulator [Caldithrix sp.]
MQQILTLADNPIMELHKNDLVKNEVMNLIHFDTCCELIEHILTKRSDLVVIDIDYLKDRTIKLMRVIKLLNDSMRVVLLCSEENIRQLKEALSFGVVAYLMKPFNEKEFSKILDNLTIAHH